MLPFEVCNGLVAAVVQKRLDLKSAITLYQGFLDLSLPLEATNHTSALKLAVSTKLSVYDAAYLLLARQLKVKLFTRDAQLLRSAKENLS